MSKTLRVGCPMWANRSWVGRYFPKGTRAGQELAAYATWCTAVEGNTSFYATPSVDAVTAWAAAAPDDFRFCFKLPKLLTHDKRLRHADDELAVFIARMAPLGSRLGPFSIQLPASFEPEDLGVLDAFLRACPKEWSWSVEVRHPTFSDGGEGERQLNDLLYERGADRVILDSRAFFASTPRTPEEREAWDRKPRLPVRPVALHDHPVVRFIGQTEPQPTIEFWQPWVKKIADWVRSGREPFFFLHTPDNAVAPELARKFHAEVAALVPDMEPLPEPIDASPVSQPELF